MTDREADPAARDRGLRLVRQLTLGGIGSAIGLSGIFSTVAAASFSGTPPAPRQLPPEVPKAATPVQLAPLPPIVITQVVHYPVQRGSASSVAAGPAPPSRAPVPMALLAPPRPRCVSTPSHVC